MLAVTWLETAQARRATFRAVLAPEELATAERMRALNADADGYLAARWLVRACLSRAVPAVAPAAWTFARTEAGKPFVTGPGHAADLHFNLSHTDGLVACAVGTSAVGIDVEALERGTDILATVHRAFAPRELVPAPDARRAVELWTVKEAYLKGLGTGIARHLDRFVVVPEAPDRWRAEESADWCVHTRLVGGRWVLAVAARVTEGAPTMYADVA